MRKLRLGLGADRRDDLGTQRLGDLDRHTANARGTSLHQHALSGAHISHAPDGVNSGDKDQRDGGQFFGWQPRIVGKDPPGADLHELRIAAPFEGPGGKIAARFVFRPMRLLGNVGRIARSHDDLLPRGESGYALAVRLDYADHIRATNMRQRNVAADRTRSDQRVIVIDAYGFDPHQHISGTGPLDRYLASVEDIEAAELPDCHRLHAIIGALLRMKLLLAYDRFTNRGAVSPAALRWQSRAVK